MTSVVFLNRNILCKMHQNIQDEKRKLCNRKADYITLQLEDGIREGFSKCFLKLANRSKTLHTPSTRWVCASVPGSVLTEGDVDQALRADLRLSEERAQR